MKYSITAYSKKKVDFPTIESMVTDALSKAMKNSPKGVIQRDNSCGTLKGSSFLDLTKKDLFLKISKTTAMEEKIHLSFDGQKPTSIVSNIDW